MIKRSTIAALSVSAVALVAVTVHEGFSDRPYLDSVGVPTIGFGRTENVRPDERTTPQRELVLVLNDIEDRKKIVEGCVTAPLHQSELDAYMSLAYNIGTGAFCGSTLVKKLNQQDYAGACAEILRWDKAGGKQLPGLTKRRQAEYKQCVSSHEDPRPQPVGVLLVGSRLAAVDRGPTG